MRIPLTAASLFLILLLVLLSPAQGEELSASAVPAGQEERVEINFAAADILQVLETYARLSGCAVLPGDTVMGQISIIASGPVAPAEAMRLIEASLTVNGYVVDKSAPGIVAVRKKEMDPQFMRAYDIKYLNAEELRNALGQVLGGLSPMGPSPQVTSNENELIITASASIHAEMQKLIDSLDKRIRQVLIEAKFIEVTLTNETKFGFEWEAYSYYNHSAGHDTSPWATTPPTASEYTLRQSFNNTWWDTEHLSKVLSQEGFKYTFINTPELMGFVHAASTDNRIRVLATPRLVATAGQEAELFIGEEIPTLDSVTYDSNDNPIRSYSNREAGITLRITPRISDQGDVTLDMHHELNDVISVVSEADLQYTFGKRRTTTQVVVRDGSTLVIGGLMKENMKQRVYGVPLLKNIPYLGKAFSYEITSPEKTELLLFLTPTVIRNPAEGGAATQRQLEKMPAVSNMSGDEILF